MKRSFYFLMIMCVAFVVASCDKTKSYTEHLKDERKAIDRLIDREGIRVLKNYPADGVFQENEFVKLDNDVYINVIDSGNGERAVLGKTKVLCRFIANDIIQTDTTTLLVDNLSSLYNNRWGFPTEFVFGYNVYSGSNYQYAPDGFVGEGLATGLYHVGDGAIVKLIVPFKRMSNTYQSNYIPIYFSKVRYTFEK